MKILIALLFFIFTIICNKIVGQCKHECVALASYYVLPNTTLSFKAYYLNSSIQDILSYNREIRNPDLIYAGTRINVPFPCGCVRGEFQEFQGYEVAYRVERGDNYELIAETYYVNLTSVEMMQRFNRYADDDIPVNARVNVVVNCSCGDSGVSRDYGLFITYPIRVGDSLSSIADGAGVSEEVLRSYNPGSDFNSGRGLVFVPGRDQNGSFPPLILNSSSIGGISIGAIAGIIVAGVAAAAIFLAICFYVKRKVGDGSVHREELNGHGNTTERTSETGPLVDVGLKGIAVNKSVEFSYEEIVEATDDFNLAHKIGQGGFGAVYYAVLRGERAAIKKMDMQASKEFLAELKVLTNVHHLNLVHLIGYCVHRSLFLVYEFIENGNLSQHLRGSSGREPLSWPTRVQIALDSARGLEYIHEHTVPLYIHRDIKSPNILIDHNLRAKVADFGLTKLIEVGGGSLQTRLVGTFGYIPPEYALYGEVSPKIDVYAFGVVLYELISGKEAIVKTNEDEDVSETRGLVNLFEKIHSQPDACKDLYKLVDPRLGDNFSLDSVHKIAQLAKACTHEDPLSRPSMRSIVVALMTLSSTTEN